ncbi:MAG: RNA polymerase sigma factor [Firmicutes bacterium]|nr:RNA polymerase sigma factor [Bacillota bacterium]
MTKDGFIDHIVEAYADTVFRISFLHTRSRSDAEDILQEVFLSMLNPPVLNDEEHLKAWIIRATINKCKNLLKSQRRKRTVPLEEAYSHAGTEPIKEEHIDLVAALQKLHEFDREILYLHYYEGYSAKEIAKIFGKSENAVFIRLNRARNELKKLLTL